MNLVKTTLSIIALIQTTNIVGQNAPLVATSKYTFLTGSSKLTDSTEYYFNNIRYTSPLINSNMAFDRDNFKFDSTLIYSDGGQAGISLSKKEEKYYDANSRVIDFLNYNISGNGLGKNSRQLFGFDQYGNRSLVINQFGYLNSWNNNSKLSQVFDNVGRLITSANYTGSGSSWIFNDSTAKRMLGLISHQLLFRIYL